MKKLKRVVIKEELVELTGDYKLALVLNQLLYWTERVGIKRYNKFEEEETEREIGEVEGLEGGWIYKTSKELSEELMIDVTDTTVRRYITELEEQGYVIERRNPRVKFDQTKQYRILLLEIRNDLNKLGYELQGYKYSDKPYGYTNPHNEDWNSNNVDCNSINEDSNSNNVDTIPEITTEITPEINSNTTDDLQQLEQYITKKVGRTQLSGLASLMEANEKHDINIIKKATDLAIKSQVSRQGKVTINSYKYIVRFIDEVLDAKKENFEDNGAAHPATGNLL